MSQNLLKSVTFGNCAFNNLYYLKVNFWERNFSITRSMSSQELCTLPVNFWLIYEPTLFHRVTFNDICVLRCKNCDLPGPLTKKINICTNNNPSPKMQRGFYSTNIGKPSRSLKIHKMSCHILSTFDLQDITCSHQIYQNCSICLEKDKWKKHFN